MTDLSREGPSSGPKRANPEEAPHDVAAAGTAGEPLPGGFASPLEEEHFVLIRETARRRRVVTKTSRTAMSSALVMLMIAAGALVGMAFSFEGWSVYLAVGLGTVGVVEYIGARRMPKGDPRAARMLGFNQLAVLAVVTIYCAGQMATFSPADAKSEMLSPEVSREMAQLPGMERSIGGLVDKWAPIVIYGFYSLVILSAIISQGAMSLYYFRRARAFQTFNAETPEWIRRLFVEMVS